MSNGEPQRQRHVLSYTSFETVVTLYLCGKSIDEIAKKCDLMPETVHDILSGEYAEEIKRRNCKPRRCPICGNLVTVWPCVACVQTPCHPLIPPLEETGSQDHLSGSEEERYNEVRHWRIVYGSPAYNRAHPLHRDTKEDKQT